MNPRNYDTENFVFTYLNQHGESALTIKRKNAHLYNARTEQPYKFYFEKEVVSGLTHAVPSCVDIAPFFSENTSADIHIHKVNQFFMPWFKIAVDCRQEIEYGIKRFFALESYDGLTLGPDQFDVLLKNTRKTYEQILERIPDLYDSRRTIAETLKLNFQDKGTSTPRGSTIFDTLDKVWVMSETTQQHPDKPEYLWRVSHFSRDFGQALGHRDFFDAVGGEAASNQACFEYVMGAQKKLYGVAPPDLDKVETDIRRLHGIIAQLELILDIPVSKTAVPDEDEE